MSIKNRVIVGERERDSGVPEILRELGLAVEYRMFEVDDYIALGLELTKSRLFWTHRIVQY